MITHYDMVTGEIITELNCDQQENISLKEPSDDSIATLDLALTPVESSKQSTTISDALMEIHITNLLRFMDT